MVLFANVLTLPGKLASCVEGMRCWSFLFRSAHEIPLLAYEIVWFLSVMSFDVFLICKRQFSLPLV
jgi:hypothetical protein